MTIEQTRHSALMYTDGGCRPTNPGNTGWGINGYIFSREATVASVTPSGHAVTTEGYIHTTILNQNTTAKPVTVIKYVDGFGGTVSEVGTNNQAEVDGLYFALIAIKDYNLEDITIYTDSEYVRKGLLEWRYAWHRNNWMRQDGLPVQNKVSWLRLIEIVDSYKLTNCKFNIYWVKGHSDVYGNILADRLATIGVMHALNGEDIHNVDLYDPKGYWKTEVDKNPLVNFSRLYFTSKQDYNIAGQYFQLKTAEEDEHVGKASSTVSYSVVKLVAPDPFIELVRHRQYAVSKGNNNVIMLKLDRLYNSEVYRYIERYGRYSLVPASRDDHGLNFLDKKSVTEEVKPSGLSLRAVENFTMLDSVLEDYITYRNQAAIHKKYVIIDITDDFYTTEIVTKKKVSKEVTVLRPEITNQYKLHKVTLQDEIDAKKPVLFNLLLGLDLPMRLQLKQLEDLNTKVLLIVWKESDVQSRYACIVDTDIGTGIWSNLHSSVVFLT